MHIFEKGGREDKETWPRRLLTESRKPKMAVGSPWLERGVVLFLTAPINCSVMKVTLSCVSKARKTFFQLFPDTNWEFFSLLSGAAAISSPTKPHLKLSFPSPCPHWQCHINHKSMCITCDLQVYPPAQTQETCIGDMHAQGCPGELCSQGC